MTTATSDDAHDEVRAPRIPTRLVYALSAWLTLVGIYATIAITQAAVEQPMPRMLHSTVVTALAVAAIAWLAVWIVAAVGRHTDAQFDAVDRRIALVENGLAANAVALAEVRAIVGRLSMTAGRTEGGRRRANRTAGQGAVMPAGDRALSRSQYWDVYADAMNDLSAVEPDEGDSQG